MLDKVYVKSQFVQIVQENSRAVIWHCLFGSPKIISLETLNFLESFSKPTAIRSKLGQRASKPNQEAVRELMGSYFLVSPDLDERGLLNELAQRREREIAGGSLIEYLELIISEACNFRCIYCMHFNNLRTSNRIRSLRKFMSFETAKKAVDWYFEVLRQHGNRIAEINFGGGEPLLAWPVIKKVLEYCHSTYGGEFEFRFTINTNASLITVSVARILKEYKVEVASSLDGLRKGNDSVRIMKSGAGTFSQIMRGFSNLARSGYPIDGVAMTVNERNFSSLNEQFVDWAVAQNFEDIRIDIDVIGMVDIPLQEVVDRLMHIYRYGESRGIDIHGFWSRLVENLNESVFENGVSFCGAVAGNSVCISPSGDIYSCGYSTTRLGSMSEMNHFSVDGGLYHQFVADHLSGRMEMCKGCMIEGQCGGGCNITQEFAHVTNSAKMERMCDFYRCMTQELLREQLKAIDL